MTGLRSLSTAILAAVLAAVVASPTVATADGEVRISTLSTRADVVSGGDVLVEIELPDGVELSALRVSAGDRDVTDAFARRGRRVLGLVEGLADGDNELVADAGPAGGARLTVTNHPNGGPVISGPQIQPWICATEDNGLGPATDDQCNTDPVFTYQYKDATTGSFQDYDPDNPPPDSQVAETTTDQGETVKYIVRRERGVMDRGIYDVAVLFDPDQPWDPFAPQAGWNRKLLWVFGQGCETNHEQGPPPDVMNDMALSEGFAVASNALFNNTENCNDVVQAESLMMLREHVVEDYGELRYTIGSGCSGGSMSQYSIAANYPGLIDGIQPACSFPDIWTTYQEMADCLLLAHYFDETSPQLWTEPQRAEASGHASAGTCEFQAQLRSRPYTDPVVGGGCAGFEWTYDPESNPDGARCDIQDYEVAIFGTREDDGFAKRPYDNVGIQWGLQALEDGVILPEQFVDLNEKIGGLDIDAQFQPERSVADPEAIEIAYRSGRLNNGRELAKVPIFDLRGSSNLEEHYDWHSHNMQARLERDNGHSENFVYWNSPGPLLPHPPITEEAFRVIEDWLAAIEADGSDAPLEQKVLANRPDEAVTACWIGGEKITDQATCDAALPYFRDARYVAGGPATADVIKCQLQPLARDAYSVDFTDDQWARLEAAFPDGVCDYSKPGVSQQAPEGPWFTFAGGPGGRPLGPAPASVPFGGTGGTGAEVTGAPLPSTGGGAVLAALLLVLAAFAVRRRPLHDTRGL